MQHPKQAAGTIAGRVIYDGGAPVVDAVVLITGNSPLHKDIAALTNEYGEYRFDGLVTGKYTIMVNANGLAVQIGEATVKRDRITYLNFSLDV